MQQDFATGRRIARQCKQMSIAAFVAALDVEFAQGAYADRFDSEDGSTAMMRAAITALLAYTSAGGTLDLGHGWRIEQDKENVQ